MNLANEDTDPQADDPRPGGYWTPKSYAARRKQSEHALYLERKRGDGPPFVIFPRNSVRYPVDLALEWEKQRQFTSAAEHLAADRRRARVVAAEQKSAAERRPAALEARLAKARKRRKTGTAEVGS